jgi:SAM-dependent methyltransferase
MKNKDFFYQQYNKISWKNQDKTKINSLINNHIIDSVILKHKKPTLQIFDIGFGIGFFFKMLNGKFGDNYTSIKLEGCEPAITNSAYFKNKKGSIRWNKNISIKTYNTTFLETNPDGRFDFITAIYVFPSFVFDELDQVVKKAYSLLNDGGKFIIVVAEENYLKNKLEQETDLFIERNRITYDGKEYEEILHYTDIPEIGKVIDYNRSESFYNALFIKNNFRLTGKEKLNDSGFISTMFIFEK